MLPSHGNQYRTRNGRRIQFATNAVGERSASWSRPHLLSWIIGPAAIAFLIVAVASIADGSDERAEAVSPVGDVIRPFNGKDLKGLSTWLKETGKEDPKGVFSVEDGAIHISGEGLGYVATEKAYKNYHLVVEYRWGDHTDGSGYVRNSGVLLHAVGPDGGANGTWMTTIECQLAQGCEGDLIVIRGKDEFGNVIPATITSETILASDGRTRWKKGGKKTPYSGKQFWWSKHQVGFKELLDTRGSEDAASPLGEWTRVECICDEDMITVKVNGVTVNQCFDVFPSAGKILLQNEGNEIYFRDFELRPLNKN